MKLKCCVIILLGAVCVGGREFSDAEYYQLPRLFQLDDYQQCFSRSEGLYCLGTFHVTPAGSGNTVYDLIQEYSSDPHHFNRSLIHRGYCVSSKCPDLNGSYAVRFQTCTERINHLLLQVDQPAEKMQSNYQSENSSRITRKIHTRLIELRYCHTKVEDQEKNLILSLDLAKLVFFFVCCAVGILNLIGSFYDMKTEEAKKNQFLTAWSVQKNWKLLTYFNKKTANSPLAALHGARVGITICVCLAHSALLHLMTYTYNPRALEEIVSHPLSMIVQNSTGFEQMLFLISGFLLVRQIPGKQPPDIREMMLFIAKRIMRLLPVFLLVVGFAATWWPVLSAGPVWSAVEEESRICRRKFWTHALFVNNLLEPENFCILSTWHIAVDFQLHVVSVILLVVLMQLRIPKVPTLVVIFLGSALLNAGLAHTFNWSPMVYLITSSENIRTVFRKEPSFAGLYMSPWGNLPACVLGLIVGHLPNGARIDHLKDKNAKRYKWYLAVICIFLAPISCGWVFSGYWLQHVRSRWFVAAYTAIERSIFLVCTLLSFCAVSGLPIRVLSWRGWHALSRLSYPVMLVHWLVNLYIVASTPQPLNTSISDIGIHGYITAFYSFIAAVPITLLVEMPMRTIFGIIASKRKI